MISDDYSALESGPCYSFAEWPNPDLPRVAAGVYTIWRGEELVYVGMSGHTLTAAQIEALRSEDTIARGLCDRLRSHRVGRRGGDQFCLYVFDRFVLPELTSEEVDQVQAGRLSLDARTREYIQQHLCYRFVETPDGAAALELERQLRAGRLKAGEPMLNPLR